MSVLGTLKLLRPLSADMRKALLRQMFLPYASTRTNVAMWIGICLGMCILLVPFGLIGYAMVVSAFFKSLPWWVRGLMLGWWADTMLTAVLNGVSGSLTAANRKEAERTSTALVDNFRAWVETARRAKLEDLRVRSGRETLDDNAISILAATIEAAERAPKPSRPGYTTNPTDPLQDALQDIVPITDMDHDDFDDDDDPPAPWKPE